MILRKLQLQNFRSYQRKIMNFSQGVTLVMGPNASGKTNVLEAINMLASGNSFRAKLGEEMIRYGQELGRVSGDFEGALSGVDSGNEKVSLEIILTVGHLRGEKAPKKKYLVNGVSRRKMDFVGNLHCVLFRPEDLQIIIDSPSVRRRYLDDLLEMVDREYRRASLSYQKGLRQRNRLLEQVRDKGRPRSILYFWDKLLIENGGLINQKRGEFINFVSRRGNFFTDLKLDYGQSVISAQRLEKYARAEMAAGVTLVGPHRDDFTFEVRQKQKSRDLSKYGSRGEQRLAILSLKLAELEFVASKIGKRPVLLLDDIFSELDAEHRKEVLGAISRQQTIITATELKLLPSGNLRRVKKIEVPVSF